MAQNYFDDEEFRCPCSACRSLPLHVNEDLRELLNLIRVAVGRPLRIAANRCEAHNAAIKGSKGSRHISGHAADISCKDGTIRSSIVGAAISSRLCRGIGVYNKHIHVDVFRLAGEPRTVWSGISK